MASASADFSAEFGRRSRVNISECLRFLTAGSDLMQEECGIGDSGPRIWQTISGRLSVSNAKNVSSDELSPFSTRKTPSRSLEGRSDDGWGERGAAQSPVPRRGAAPARFVTT